MTPQHSTLDSQLSTIQQHQLRGDAELARQIQAEIDARRNTRGPIDVETFWAICRRCAHYRGNRCAALELFDEFQATGDGDPVQPTFAELLTREEFRCRLWRPNTQIPNPKSQISNPLPATSTSEAALDRIHRQGVKRTQAERRAARRKPKRRIK